MAELADYGIDHATLQRMYDEWRNGAKKSALERQYLGEPESHGKLFTSLVREHLGIETERHSGQTNRVRALEREVERLSECCDRTTSTPRPERPSSDERCFVHRCWRRAVSTTSTIGHGLDATVSVAKDLRRHRSLHG